jgi:hypothetical protein
MSWKIHHQSGALIALRAAGPPRMESAVLVGGRIKYETLSVPPSAHSHNLSSFWKMLE